MAIWQFGFYLVPVEGVLKIYNKIPLYLDEYKPRHATDTFDENKIFVNYWNNMKISNDILNLVAKHLKKIESWSDEATMFGDNNGNQIEIWEDEFICLFDARNLKLSLLKEIVKIGKSLNCITVLKENAKVIETELSVLHKYFNNSLANKFVLDQEGTLTNLKKNRYKILK